MTDLLQKLRRWLSGARRSSLAAPVQLTLRPASTITLAEWQGSELLVAEGSRLLSDRSFKLALELLHRESPALWVMPEVGTPLHDRAAQQARIEGYHLCLRYLEALGTLKVAEQQVEATFLPPENEGQPQL